MKHVLTALALIAALASPVRAGSPLPIDLPDMNTKEGQAAMILGSAIFVDTYCPLMSTDMGRLRAILSQYGFALQDFRHGKRDRMVKQTFAYHRQVTAKLACETLYGNFGPQGDAIPGLLSRQR